MSKKHKKIVDWSGSEKQEYMRVKEDFFNHNWEIVDEKNITNCIKKVVIYCLEYSNGLNYIGVTNSIYERIVSHILHGKINSFLLEEHAESYQESKAEIIGKGNIWSNDYYKVKIWPVTFTNDTLGNEIAPLFEQKLIDKYGSIASKKTYANISQGEHGNNTNFLSSLKRVENELEEKNTSTLDVFETKISVIVLEEISIYKVNEAIGTLLSSILCKIGYKELHQKNKYKGYSFSPLEMLNLKEKHNYSSGSMHSFYFRTLDAELIRTLVKELNKDSFTNKAFTVLGATIAKPKIISNNAKTFTFNTLSPAVIVSKTKEEKQRSIKTENISREILFDAINNNLRNKVKQFYSINMLPTDWIIDITMNSRNNFFYQYKGTEAIKPLHIYGTSLELVFKKNTPKELLSVIFANGIGEKNSCLGAGYVSLEKSCM